MKLKEIRISKGLTQQDIAEYLDCDPSVYCRYENGKRIPPIDVLIKLSKYLGVSIDYIVGVDDVTPIYDLTEPEIFLINTYRNADKRAKEDAITMLTAHNIKH